MIGDSSIVAYTGSTAHWVDGLKYAFEKTHKNNGLKVA